MILWRTTQMGGRARRNGLAVAARGMGAARGRRLGALVLLLAALWARPALALEPMRPEEVCRRIRTYSGEAECLRVIEGRYTSALAAAACDRIPSNEGTLECMRLIAGRVLSREVVLSCDDEPSTRATLSCFAAAAGAPTDPAGSDRRGPGGPPRYDRRGGYPPGPPPAPDPRGSCNQYGCARNGGSCNQYGCWHSPQGSCNQYGCRDYGACNQYGCWRLGGGCNQYGCWNSPRGACNQYGCSEYGTCNQYGCPR